MAESIVKAAAVGGVAAMWSYFTLKTFRLWGYFTHETLKICDKIVFPPEKPPVYQCENCSYYFTSDFMTEREGYNCYFYVCKRCEDEEGKDEELETRYGDEKIFDLKK